MTIRIDNPLDLLKPHFVYELYATDGTCLYIGCSRQFGIRFEQHQSKPLWLDIQRIKADRYENYDTAREAEAERIRAVKPVYNKTFASRPTRSSWEIELVRRAEIHAGGELCDYRRCRVCHPIQEAKRLEQLYVTHKTDIGEP